MVVASRRVQDQSNSTTISTDLTRDILEVFQVDTSFNRWTNLLVLMIFPIFFHLLALLASACYIGSRRKNSRLRKARLAVFGKQKAEFEISPSVIIEERVSTAVAVPNVSSQTHETGLNAPQNLTHPVAELSPKMVQSASLTSLARRNTHPVRPQEGLNNLRARVASHSSFMLPGLGGGIVE